MTRRLSAVPALAALILVSAAAEAAFLRDVPQRLVQPDGSTVDCLASGDEYYSWLHDADGYVIVRDRDTGWLVYADRLDGRLVPTTLVVGRSDPAAAGLQPGLRPDPRVLPHPDELFPRGLTAREASVSAAGTFSRINNIVIFIRFSDESEFGQPIAGYSDLLNASGTGASSMYNFFLEASYGTLQVPSTFYPAPSGGYVVSYRDSYPRSYFKPYDATTNPNGYQDSERAEREHLLLKRAVDAVSWQIPGSLVVDSDGDGYVDNVCFIVRGGPTAWSTLLWPHRWFMSSQYAAVATINGKQVDAYNFQLQDKLGVGVLCHEMTHTLGAPDLYRYSSCSSNSDFDPVGKWDLMNQDLDPPQHSGAFMKFRYMGWISSIPSITASGTYTLNPITSPANNAFKIASPNSSDEYFVVEYRRRAGTFESSLPGSGLVVTRINTAASGDGNRCGPPDEVHVFRPGGSSTVEGDLDNAYLTADAGRTTINDGSDPAAFLQDGSPGGLSISNVGTAGATITFTVNLGGGSCDPPAAFQLTAPANGASLSAGTTTATLQWSSAAGAQSYDVYFGTALAPPLVGTVSGTSRTVTVAAGGTYRWRVVAKNSCGETAAPGSGTWSFSVPGGSSDAVVFADAFESSFPGGWQVLSASGTAWGRSTYRAAGGSGSAWCAAGGSAPQPAGGPYASEQNTWLVHGPFSLTGATAASAEFDLWAETESGYDYVKWMVSVDGTHYYGYQTSGSTGGWSHRVFDFADVEAIDVLGQPSVWFAFIFSSDESVQKEGAYVDNLVIRRGLGGGCTFSIAPTSASTTASGGMGTVAVSASSPECQWSASSQAAWISVTSGSSGTGNGSVTYTVSANASSSSRTGTLAIAGQTFTVSQSGTTCTQPSITGQPSSTVISSGSTAALHVQATGTGPLTYQWYQGSSGNTSRPVVGALASSYTTPSLTASASYWVRVSNACGSQNSATATVTVTGGGASYLYLVPSVAHNTGKVGTNWRTDLAVTNRSGSTAVLSLTYYPESGSPVVRSATLANGTPREWRDVLVSLFGVSVNSKGTLHVDANVPLCMATRTYNQKSPTESYGQYYPALEVGGGIAAGDVGVIPHIKNNAEFRTNVGAVNLGSSTTRVRITLYDENGSPIGTPRTESVPAGLWKQVNDIFAATGAGTRNLAYATVETLDGAPVWAYASVVDATTGDPTTIPVMVATTLVVFADEAPVEPDPDAGSARIDAVLDRTRLRRIAPPAAAVSAAGTLDQAATVFQDSFETTFPGASWQVYTSTGAAWGSSTYRVSSGSRSVWCAGGGSWPATPGSSYESDMETWMVTGPFSLADATAARATFRAWLDTEEEWSGWGDPFAWLISTDGQNFSGFKGSGSSGGWVSYELDFADVADGEALGAPQVWFAFMFRSDSSIEYEGVYVDELSISKETSSLCSLTCSAWVPTSGQVGSPVSFTGSVDASGCSTQPSASWSFGDGQSVANRTSTSHTYMAAGTYAWTFTATADGRSCSRTGTISIAGSGGGGDVLAIVPSVAHSPGKAGAQWRTDLAVVNHNGLDASVELTYYPESGNAVTRWTTVASGASREWRDVLVVLFGIDVAASSKGTVHVASTVPLYLTSRTYNRKSATETFGQYYPALDGAAGIAVGQTGVIPQLKKNATFRTNLGYANLGTAPAVVQVRLYGPAGSQIGSTRTVTVAAGMWVQDDDIFAKVGAAGQDIACATVTVLSGARVWAYASVVDNATSDPTTIPVLGN